MSQQPYIRSRDDDVIEWQFVLDYALFALQMNFLAVTALLENARSVSEAVSRKSICLSGLQLVYSSYEDFAILLHAFRNRKEGKHLHLTIGVEDQTHTAKVKAEACRERVRALGLKSKGLT